MTLLFALVAVAVAALTLAYLRERRLLARDFRDEAATACTSGVSLSIHGIAIGRLIYALRDAASRAYPALAGADIAALVRRGLTIRCEACGPLSERALNELIVTQASIAAGGQDLLGKDADVANRSGGSCAGCGRSMFRASFDPEVLRAAAAKTA
ncbi:MAG: hypothetical protein U0610_16010 [bacterium]